MPWKVYIGKGNRCYDAFVNIFHQDFVYFMQKFSEIKVLNETVVVYLSSCLQCYNNEPALRVIESSKFDFLNFIKCWE